MWLLKYGPDTNPKFVLLVLLDLMLKLLCWIPKQFRTFKILNETETNLQIIMTTYTDYFKYDYTKNTNKVTNSATGKSMSERVM